MSHVEGFDFKRGSNAVCDVGDLNDYDHIINIDPTTSDDSNCNSQLFDRQRHMTCPDVNMALKFHADSTAYVFASGANITHYLKQDSMTSFKSQSKVGFFSSDISQLASVECLDNAGFAFTNVNSIKIHRVVFSYCGVCRNTTSKEYTKKDKLHLIEVKAGLYFYNGSDVTMCHVTVQHGPDAVGVVMYDVDRTVNVYNSTFYNNTCSEQSGPRGGGVVIEFSSCVPGNRECMEQTSHYANANYTFNLTSFRNNSAIKFKQTHQVEPNGEEYHEFGYGGGMAISFSGNATGNSVRLQGCTFVGNRAASGGGLFINFADTSIRNCVVMDNKTQFVENECPTTTVGGGGICIISELSFTGSGSKVGNSVKVSGLFISNTAENGGAIAYTLAYRKKLYLYQTTTVAIVDSYFYDNRALVGAAVHLEIHPLFVWGIVNFVIIKNSTFYLNSIGYASKTSDGVVYSSRVPLRFMSAVNFTDNYGTALALVSTYATFYDSILTFVKNRGDTGGAIALLGNSHAVVSNTTDMHFEGNFAHKGGAITLGNIRTKFNTACFIRYLDPLTSRRDWDVNFTFINNTSTDHKRSSIFSTSVYPCAHRNRERGPQLSDAIMFCTNPDLDFSVKNCMSRIETEGDMYIFLNKSVITAYPEHGFKLPIKVMDDIGHDITDLVGYTSTVPTVNQVNTPFYNSSIVITGQENTTSNLELQSSVSGPHSLQIEKECPPGFHLSGSKTMEMGTLENNTDQCTCISLYSYRKKLKCYNQNAQIVWNYWIGFTNRSGNNLVMSSIPISFYNSILKNNCSGYIDLPKSYDELILNEAVCGIMNRTGVICGECKENFSTAINSYLYVCIQCDDNTNFPKNIFLFMLFAYVPYIILLAIIVIFNLKLTSSASSGFILFAQMMSMDVFNIKNDIHVTVYTFNIHQAYLFVYGIFNFNNFADVMEPFCISKNFSALDVLLVEYTSAVLPLLMIVLIYLLLRCKSVRFLCCCGKKNLNIRSSSRSGRKKRRRNSLIHAFVACLLLSYTKLSKITKDILAVQRLFDEDGHSIWNDSRVYMAGHLSFTSKEYFFPYGFIAMIVLVFFVLLPPLFLLGLPQLVDKLLDKERFSCLRRLWPTLTIHIFLDAFQGFYKPNRRPFAGIYFVFRLVIIFTYIWAAADLDHYILQQFFITVMIILLAVFRPYKRKIFNIVDIAIFLNLAVINLISTYAYAASSLDGKVANVIYFIQYFLIWLPLVYILSYLMYKLLVKLGVRQLITDKLQKSRGDQQYLTNNTEVEVENCTQVTIGFQSSDQEMLSDSALFSRAGDINMFRSSGQGKRLLSMSDKEESLKIDRY